MEKDIECKDLKCNYKISHINFNHVNARRNIETLMYLEEGT